MVAGRRIHVHQANPRKKPGFLVEVRQRLLDLWAEHGTPAPFAPVEDAFALNRVLLSQPFVFDDAEVTLGHDVWRFFRGILQGEPRALQAKRSTYRIERSKAGFLGLLYWCRRSSGTGIVAAPTTTRASSSKSRPRPNSPGTISPAPRQELPGRGSHAPPLPSSSRQIGRSAAGPGLACSPLPDLCASGPSMDLQALDASFFQTSTRPQRDEVSDRYRSDVLVGAEPGDERAPAGSRAAAGPTANRGANRRAPGPSRPKGRFDRTASPSRGGRRPF